ncbi:MAG: TetR/AcrR family transcriptional regulator [Rhodospirillales bacterium]
MAKQPQGKTPRKPKRKSTDQAETPEVRQTRIIDAAMACIARDGWRRFSLAQVAAETDLPLSDILIPFPTKHAVINAFQDRIDERMLATADDLMSAGDDGGNIRDRLFDLLMERFDALSPYRAAMAEIAKDALCDPASLRFVPHMARTMSRVLEAAGIGTSGSVRLLQTKGLALVYADAFRIWLRDDSADLAKTMAALDRGLRRAEKAMRILCSVRRRGTPDMDTSPDIPST